MPDSWTIIIKSISYQQDLDAWTQQNAQWLRQGKLTDLEPDYTD